MRLAVHASIPEALRDAAIPLRGDPTDYDSLLERIGEARLVLLGEATHGTHEFYRQRARITQRLIGELGFLGVAAEADWPDAWRVNRYVQGEGSDRTAVESLADFQRFPAWMWRNADVLDFVGWLRDHNDQLPRERKAGFFGLDLYSLHRSIRSVLDYLEEVDSAAAGRARARYACFEHFGEDPQAYGYTSAFGMSETCEQQVVQQLLEMRRQAEALAWRDGMSAEDAHFFAEQNAAVVRNAERYYRSMFSGRVSSWNLRDQHMAEILEALLKHLDRTRPGSRPARLVVWAHNSHLGDARATQMGRRGEWNLGQLVRERMGRQAVLVGFTTYEGSVTAADDWDGPARRRTVRHARADSYEALLHEVDAQAFLLPLDPPSRAAECLRENRLERAIGVIYRPQTELASHYFEASLASQFDLLLHFDRTRAVEPLEKTPGWISGEPPETYPTGY